MSARSGFDRRQFLKTSAGLVIGFYVVPRAGLSALQAPADKPLPDPNAFLRIGEDDSVTVLLSHSEMGQGIWTTLPMLVAEELGCDWAKVRVEHAPAAPAYAHTAYGIQMTGGSTSTWSEFDRYRQVGAMAREMLVRAAAARWKVDPSACRAENGYVVHGGDRLSFGKLASAAQQMTPPREARLKDPKDWKILGKATRRLDSPEQVTGRAQFGMDVRLPGMLTALVARSPVFGGKVKSFRAERARRPGRQGRGPGPLGSRGRRRALLGREARPRALVDWDLGPARISIPRLRGIFALWRASRTGRGGRRRRGRSAKGRQDAQADEFPYLARHDEPMNCTARAPRVQIWAGASFRPWTKNAAQITGLKRSR
jgi:isoquinoline 1-oxidoreductase beta subunit